jgi:hypothetical protein
MAQCSKCNSETLMYECNVPICVACADRIDKEKALPVQLKIHLKETALDRLSLCRVWPATNWILREATQWQADGTICKTCVKNAASHFNA